MGNSHSQNQLRQEQHNAILEKQRSSISKFIKIKYNVGTVNSVTNVVYNKNYPEGRTYSDIILYSSGTGQLSISVNCVTQYDGCVSADTRVRNLTYIIMDCTWLNLLNYETREQLVLNYMKFIKCNKTGTVTSILVTLPNGSVNNIESPSTNITDEFNTYESYPDQYVSPISKGASSIGRGLGDPIIAAHAVSGDYSNEPTFAAHYEVALVEDRMPEYSEIM